MRLPKGPAGKTNDFSFVLRGNMNVERIRLYPLKGFRHKGGV